MSILDKSYGHHEQSAPETKLRYSYFPLLQKQQFETRLDKTSAVLFVHHFWITLFYSEPIANLKTWLSNKFPRSTHQTYSDHQTHPPINLDQHKDQPIYDVLSLPSIQLQLSSSHSTLNTLPLQCTHKGWNAVVLRGFLNR